MEFEQVTFPASISSDDGIWREFLEIDNNSMFSKKWVLQKRKFSYPVFQLLRYNKVIVR